MKTALTQRPPALPPARVRLGAAADPWVFTMVIAGLTTSLIAGSMGFLGGVILSLVALVAASPWIGPLRRRVERRAWVRHRRRLEQRRRKAEVGQLDALPPALRERYLELKLRARDVPLRQSPNLDMQRLQKIEGRLDDLLSAHLRLLRVLHACAQHLHTLDRGQLEHQIARTEDEIRTTTSAKLQGAHQTRLGLLRARLTRLDRVAERREIALARLATIEDLVALMDEPAFGVPGDTMIEDQLETILAEVEAAEAAAISIDETPEEALAGFERRLAG